MPLLLKLLRFYAKETQNFFWTLYKWEKARPFIEIMNEFSLQNGFSRVIALQDNGVGLGVALSMEKETPKTIWYDKRPFIKYVSKKKFFVESGQLSDFILNAFAKY